jgi:hypothetical protein
MVFSRSQNRNCPGHNAVDPGIKLVRMIFDSLPPWIVDRGDQAVPTSSSQPEDIGRAPQAWTRLGTVRLTIKARPRSYTAAMPTARDPLYQRHRFPPEVISHAVWLYFRFPLSLRMVEE